MRVKVDASQVAVRRLELEPPTATTASLEDSDGAGYLGQTLPNRVGNSLEGG